MSVIVVKTEPVLFILYFAFLFTKIRIKINTQKVIRIHQIHPGLYRFVFVLPNISKTITGFNKQDNNPASSFSDTD